ncbi:MAG: glycoside hydrolase family 25 protein [Lachnospiraceae bacterium]
MANSFYDQDPEDSWAYKKMIMLCVTAASIVMLLFLVFLYINSQNKQKKEQTLEPVQTKAEEDIEFGKSNLTSADLDFWNMYEEEEQEPEEETTNSVSANFTDKRKPPAKEEEEKKESMTDQPEEEPLLEEGLDDGNHIAIEDEKGKKTWYEILQTVPKNTYQLSEYLKADGERLSYTDGGRQSAFGIDVSKHQGTIDWELVKKDGVQFAMLRVASRGYGSGQLLLDDNFVQYADGAKKNGINLGVYVYSQAVNETEAIEEANFAVAAVSNYKIAYPIACDVEMVDNDTARTDKLTVEERTKCVKAFCDTVKTYGYKPVIYADRDMLISGLDMEVLKDYDVWLSDVTGLAGGDVIQQTDYPYQFTIWQYSNAGTVNGISGSVDLNISFVNYEEK